MGIGNFRGWRPFVFSLPLLISLPILFSVSELHRKSNPVQDLSRKHAKKFDHLVLGPAAGQGLPDRLQCRGLKALNRTLSSPTSRILNSSNSISFVTVFAVYNSSPTARRDDKIYDIVTVGNTSYSKVERSMAILDTFINFIQAFLETRYEDHFQRKSHSINHYIFTDSDVAVVDDLGHMFHKYPDFHLALTFRNNKDQPLNSGFIAVRGTLDGILKAKIFLQEVLEVYSSKYMKASRMLGDQLALAWVIKSHPSFDAKRFKRPEAFLDEIHGALVMFLPCAVYNWTPPEGAGQFHGMPLDVKVVHFKGSRKRLMLESWNFYSSSPASDISDMLCLILKSGRTKYDF